MTDTINIIITAVAVMALTYYTGVRRGEKNFVKILFKYLPKEDFLKMKEKINPNSNQQ